MAFPVIKGTAYALIYNSLIIGSYGNHSNRRKTHKPNSEYLKQVPQHLRSYEECINFAPNQVFYWQSKTRISYKQSHAMVAESHDWCNSRRQVW
jgi:hypothetical protein